MGTLIAVMIVAKLKPVTAHLAAPHDCSPLRHLLNTFSKRNYRIGFLATAFPSIGGFMMMRFSSAFAVNNLKVTHEQLPSLFMVSGCNSLVIMPLIGRIADRIDKWTFILLHSSG